MNLSKITSIAKTFLSFPKQIQFTLGWLVMMGIIPLGLLWFSFSVFMSDAISRNSTTLMEMSTLAVFVVTNFVLVRLIWQRARVVVYYLVTAGVVSGGLVSLAVSIVLYVLFSLGHSTLDSEPFGVAELVGSVLFLTITFLPSLIAVLVYRQRNFFTVKASQLHRLTAVLLALIVTMSNTMWLIIFTYLLLVLLFPGDFGFSS